MKETPKKTTQKSKTKTKENIDSKTDSQKKESKKTAAKNDKDSTKTPRKHLNPFGTAQKEFKTFSEVHKEALDLYSNTVLCI